MKRAEGRRKTETETSTAGPDSRTAAHRRGLIRMRREIGALLLVPCAFGAWSARGVGELFGMLLVPALLGFVIFVVVAGTRYRPGPPDPEKDAVRDRVAAAVWLLVVQGLSITALVAILVLGLDRDDHVERLLLGLAVALLAVRAAFVFRAFRRLRFERLELEQTLRSRRGGG